MKKILPLVTLLISLTMLLAGCGGETKSAEEQAGNADLSNVKIVFTAKQLSYTDYPKVIKKSDANPDGTYTIGLRIEGPMSHDVVIDDLNNGEPLVYGQTEGTYKATVKLKPGKYTFYCSIPGHRAAGMVGEVEIE